MSKKDLNMLSHVCFVGGFASILASIAIWRSVKSPELTKAIENAHTERFGIFVGLWAPTFFALSDRLNRYANAAPNRTEK